MKKPLAFLVGVSLVSAPALGQVRPQDCQPVFPLMDDVAMLPPPDVVAQPAAPIAQAAARRGFFGLPFLLPLLGLVGGIAALAIEDIDNNQGPVSPA